MNQQQTNESITAIINWLIGTNNGAYVFSALLIIGIIATVSGIVVLALFIRGLYNSRISSLEDIKNKMLADRDAFQERLRQNDELWYLRYEKARKDVVDLQMQSIEVSNGLKDALNCYNEGLKDLVETLNKIYINSFKRPDIKRTSSGTLKKGGVDSAN